MTDIQFTCQKCHGTFNKSWSEEEAEKEFSTSPWGIPGDDRVIICDDCFQLFKKWFDSLTPEQQKQIKKNIPSHFKD